MAKDLSFNTYNSWLNLLSVCYMYLSNHSKRSGSLSRFKKFLSFSDVDFVFYIWQEFCLATLCYKSNDESKQYASDLAFLFLGSSIRIKYNANFYWLLSYLFYDMISEYVYHCTNHITFIFLSSALIFMILLSW